MRDFAIGVISTTVLWALIAGSIQRSASRRIEALSMYVGLLEERARSERVGAGR